MFPQEWVQKRVEQGYADLDAWYDFVPKKQKKRQLYESYALRVIIAECEMCGCRYHKTGRRQKYCKVCTGNYYLKYGKPEPNLMNRSGVMKEKVENGKNKKMQRSI